MLEQAQKIFTLFLQAGGVTLLLVLARWLAAKIPQNSKFHSAHAALATALSTAADAAEHLVKGVLTGPFLEQVLANVASGQSIAVALGQQLPNLVAALRTAIGPGAADIVDAVLKATGGQQRLQQVIVAATHDLLLVHQQARQAATPPPPPPALPKAA